MSNLRQNLNQFLAFHANQNSDSKHTFDAYNRDIQRFIEYLETQNIQEFNQVDIHIASQYIMYIKDGEGNIKRLSNASVARNLSSLRTFYYFLIEFYQIKINPFTLIKQSNTNRNLPEVLTFDEMMSFLDSITDNSPLGLRNKTMLELMYACGLRVSELCELKVNSVNLQSRYIKVIGKGKKERIIPFYPFVGILLQRYLSEVYNLWNVSDDVLFIKSNGKGVSTRYVQLLVERIGIEADMRIKVHPHMFRHSFATHLLDNGADIRIVQELLGHENLSTTQIYTHLSIDRVKAVYLKSHPGANKN